MKKNLITLILVVFIFAGCAGNSSPSDEHSDTGQPRNSTTAESEDAVVIGQPIPINGESAAECLAAEEHPIASSIAADYADITTYDEVLGWFCNGAMFEDILNALLTEELTQVDAGNVLVMVAQGQSWDEIWLELGVTQP